MKMLVAAMVVLGVGMPSFTIAQEQFDGEAFVRELNKALKDKPGVEVKKVGPLFSKGLGEQWKDFVAASPPQFGIVAVDANDRPVELFGSETPYLVTAGKYTVPGYDLPRGGSFKPVGPAGWALAANVIAAGYATGPGINVGDDIQKAVSAVADATDYIADSLCSRKSHPTKLTLNLTAGFELVFSAETGSQVEWDLEIVCPRYSAP